LHQPDLNEFYHGSETIRFLTGFFYNWH